MSELSPAAQAVLDAAYALPLKNGQPNIAATLRAAADQVAPEQQTADKDEILIDSLHLSTRTENALKRCAVFTVGDLRNFTFSELLLIKGCGIGCADEVATSLASIGVSLFDSCQAQSLHWSNVITRKAIRAKLLAIAAELEDR